jgi:probable F420-dependent oxidoreductase
MRHGLALPQLGRHAKPAAITSFVRCAEDLGYRSFWVGDRVLTPVDPSDLYPNGGTPEHPYPDEFTTFLDPIVTLAAAATVASHSRLGMSALNAPWYNPVLLARSLTSLDNLTGGRLDCGFGTGWLRDEYTAANVSWNDRGARLDEILDVLTTIWTENPAEHHGPHFTLPRSHFDLRPTSPGGPPVLLGGWAPKAMERIGRRAAGWLPLYGIPPDLLDQLWRTACHAAQDAGRDLASLRRELRVNPKPGTTIDELATAAESAEKTGMDGVFFDLQFATTSPEEALAVAAQLATTIGIG